MSRQARKPTIAALLLLLVFAVACGKGNSNRFERSSVVDQLVYDVDGIPFKDDEEFDDSDLDYDGPVDPVTAPPPLHPAPTQPAEPQPDPSEPTTPEDPQQAQKDQQTPTAPAPRPNATPKPVRPVQTQIRGFWDEKVDEGRQWTQLLVQAIDHYGDALLKTVPQDYNEYCPRYPELSREERKDFWVKLFTALAKVESSWRPNTKFKEPFKDKDGTNVISRGLLQLSFSSSKYYHCDFKNADEIHDPQLNLECGVRIMSRWIARDGVFSGRNGKAWLGGGRYWHPMREVSKRYKWLQEQTQRVPVCRI